MKRKTAIHATIAGLGLLAACNSTTQTNKQTADKDSLSKPNILLIVSDDLGYKDLACYGEKITETPNLDQLATEGVRFTNAYASCPVSSPTRASLLTGKNPVDVDITDWIPGHQAGNIKPYHKMIVPQFNLQLPLDELTIAEQLKKLGYATASIGKWHLGGEGYLPDNQGFDINIAGCEFGMPPSYYYPYHAPNKPWGDQRITPLELTDQDSLYLTDRLAKEAVKFIRQERDEPFFLYLPFYAVHTPLEGRPDLVEKYEKKVAQSTDSIYRYPHFLALVDAMDENIGQVLKAVDDMGLEENTLIIFVSDNGGLYNRGGKLPADSNKVWASWNYPLRAGKGTLYEGGLKVPTIIKWKGHIEANQVSDEMIISTDIFPTIMEIVGLNVGEDIEGVSLWSHLTKQTPIDRETLVWHYPHYHRTNPATVYRQGDYKLIKYIADDRLELYNIAEDISETHDLSDEMPEKTEELHKKLQVWLKEHHAKMPTPNPDYDPNTQHK